MEGWAGTGSVDAMAVATCVGFVAVRGACCVQLTFSAKPIRHTAIDNERRVRREESDSKRRSAMMSFHIRGNFTIWCVLRRLSNATCLTRARRSVEVSAVTNVLVSLTFPACVPTSTQTALIRADLRITCWADRAIVGATYTRRSRATCLGSNGSCFTRKYESQAGNGCPYPFQEPTSCQIRCDLIEQFFVT